MKDPRHDTQCITCNALKKRNGKVCCRWCCKEEHSHIDCSDDSRCHCDCHEGGQGKKKAPCGICSECPDCYHPGKIDNFCPVYKHQDHHHANLTASAKCNCQFHGDTHPHKKDCPAYISPSGWKESLRAKFYSLIEGDGITAEDTFALFITEFDVILAETRQDFVQKVIEQEKAMFNVKGERYIVLNQESIEALERGERRAVPIRSYQFPSIRTTPPTTDEFNKHTIILKRD